MKLKSEIEYLAWDPMMRMVVYALYCECAECGANGDAVLRYGGQTTRTAEERLKHHKIVGRMIARGTLTAVKKMTPVGYWAAKHGPDNIRMVTLETADSVERLNEREEYWIDYLETLVDQGGLNIRRGGKNALHGPMSNDQKAKIGAGNRGKKRGPEHVERVRKMLTEARGEKSYTHVLKEPQVVDIKSRLFLGQTQTSLAEEYGVSISTISGIFHRKAWWDVPQPIGPIPKTIVRNGFGENAPFRKLDNSKVVEIKSRLWDGQFPSDIATEFDVDPGTIYQIESGQGWPHIPWPTDRLRTVRDTYARVAEKNRGRKRPEDWGERNRRTYRETALRKSVLNQRQIRYIRALRYEQGWSYREIATQMGVKEILVGKIIRGERWGWVV